MSPLDQGCCPLVVKEKNYYYCSDYEHRPKECRNHEYPARFCPIGLTVLKLIYPGDLDKIRERIDTGHARIGKGFVRSVK